MIDEAAAGHDGEDLRVQRGDGEQCGIEDFCGIRFILLDVERGEKVLGLEPERLI